MWMTLQIVLILASVSIVALVIAVVPVAIQAGRTLRHLALATERLETTAQTLLQDSRELVRNVSDLSQRTDRYMEEAGRLASIAQVWTERVDHFVRHVGSMVESPVLSLVRKTSLLRVGAYAFVRSLLESRGDAGSKVQHSPVREERYHV